MKKLTTRQVGILMFISIVGLKFVSFPSLFATYAGRDGYWGMVITMLFDLFFLGIIIFVGKRNPNKKYEDIIKDTFGDLTLRFVNLGLFLYFITKAVLLIKEHHNYMLEVLFTYLPWRSFVIPMLVLMGFIMSRSLRAVGRTAEIFFPVIVVAIIFTCGISIEYFEPTRLLPMFENGLGPVFSSSFYCNFTTGDYLVLIMLLGRFKLEKNSYKKILGFSLFAIGLVLVFYVIFFGVFGNTVVNQSLAISDLPLFATFPKHVGRLDWITINLWTIILIFQTGIALTLALHAFNKIFSIKRKITGISLITVGIYITAFLLFLNLADALAIITNANFNIIVLVLEVVIVLILFLSSMKNKRVRYDKFKKDMAK